MKRQQKAFLFSFLSILFLGSFLFLSFAFAQGNVFGLEQVGEGTGLGGQDIRITIAKIIRAVLGLLGIIAVSIMLYGGFVYMTAGGNEEKIGTAKKILINGTIGLVIILSSFSIAQFIIMQLGKATGAIPEDGVPNLCQDDSYAQKNKCKCYNYDCGGNESCNTGLEEKNYFVVKSITPVTDNTGMNNVVIRAIFNKKVAGNDKFSPDEIFDIKYKTQSVSTSFYFEFIDGEDRRLLQATYIGDKFCTDEDTGENIPCLDFGNYRVEVRPDLESVEGYLLQEETDCGTFPTIGEFTVGEKDGATGLSYLDFDGIDGRVFINGTSTADFVNDFSLSFWVYIDEQVGDWNHKYIIDNFTGGNPGAGYLVYYTQNDNPDNNRLKFSVRRDNPTLYEEEEKADQQSLATPISTSTWHHITTIYAGDSMSIYVDGALVGNLNLPDNYPLYKFGGQLVFGGTQSLNNDEYSFKGKLDEVRIYEKVLSLEEILELSQVRESNNYDGLYAGYHFEEGEGTFVGDFFDGEYHGETSGGVTWSESGNNIKTIDKQAPEFGDGLSLLNVGADDYLQPGKYYNISSEITDNSGLGVYRIQINKEVLDEDIENTADYYDGPRIIDGSDVPIEDPFDFSYPLFTSFNVEKLTHYTLILDAIDIDSNFSQTTKEYTLLPDVCFDDDLDNNEDLCGGGPGDPCTEDWQCVYNNKCVNNICTPWPKIVEVDPMHGASGNWVSIFGYNFGEEEGQVKFAIDQDGDGEVLGEEWANALPISIVKDADCGKTWKDNYIIIELPGDDAWPQGVKGAIRVSIKDDDEVGDTTNDEYGPDLGLFEKDDQKLPGLCSVKTLPDDVTAEGTTSGEPGTAIKIVGNSLGSDGVSRLLYFDDQDVPHGPWSEKEIFANVPDINLFGESAVSVLVAGKKSNSIKFEILDPNIPVIKPVITEINPTTTTPGSYVTIFGFGFGNAGGYIFIASSTAKAEDCAKNPTEAEEDEDCTQLDLLGFPLACGNTWTNTQIIAKVPLDTSTSTYFLALRNSKGDYTSGIIVDAEVKEQPFDIIDGDPYPGICKIDPNSGVAPRLGDNTIKIYGDNFTSPIDNTDVYFWINSASSTLMSTWMNTNYGVFPVYSIQGEITKQEIETNIPYIVKGSKVDGTSMVSGPIRVGVGDRYSNSVKYTVKDCRGASAEITASMSGYQCCEAEGPDQGKWKLNQYACIGESRDAGYVWRFSTGLINARPRVLEQCDEKNWNKNGFDEIYPSPTPSTLWESTGESACTNSVIAVKFNIPMAVNTINSDTVKMYDCGSGLKPDCNGNGEVIVYEGFPVLNGENVLEIRKIPPDGVLATSTWYRVELSEDIKSDPQPDNLGQLASQQYNLEISDNLTCIVDGVNDCIGFGSTSTAYSFDFKTGNFDCQMSSASIDPKTYTTHYLGKLFSPDGLPPNPLYYFVWGISDKECIVLSADQYAWKWQTDDNVLKLNVTPYGYLPTSTSRVNPDALQEHVGIPVTASTGIVSPSFSYGKEIVNVLENAGKLAGLYVTSTETALEIEDFEASDFVNFENYEIYIKYTLDEIATSSMNDAYVGVEGFDYYFAYRYIYDDGKNNFFIEDKYSVDSGERTRKFRSNLWSQVIDPINTYNENDLTDWKNGYYRIVNNEAGFQIYDLLGENVYEPISTANYIEPNEFYETSFVVGAPKTAGSFKFPLVGSITEFIIEKENLGEDVETVITVSNTTTISVYPPTVIDYGPNCAEACVNSSIWAQFSRPMALVKYKYQGGESKLKLFKCINEKCLFPLPIPVEVSDEDVIISETSDKYFLRTNLSSGLLATSTWYLASIQGGEEYGVRAEGILSKGIFGKAMEQDFVWKFRTNSDPSPCAVDNVDVSPNPFTAIIIGEQTKYSAIPRSEADKCSSMGQELNPWSYGWSWDTGDPDVATVTNFSFGIGISPYCNLGCVLKGSNVSTSTEVLYLCGNGKVDPGEDCDIADPDEDEEVGVSCTLNCLRPGNSNSGSDSINLECGNIDLDKDVGEECDPGGDKTKWQYCSQNCLNMGSSQEFSGDINVPWCGSGTVTDGEDCDLGLSLEDINKMGGPKNEASIGCSANCLHLGTELSRAWCDNNPTYADQCSEAVSWCGNGHLESGEECEITDTGLEFITSMVDSITTSSLATSTPSYYCTNKCTLRNICGLTSIPQKTTNNKEGMRCLVDTPGCNEDCTLAGSSILYINASLCGDGKVEMGESGFCEDEDAVVNEGVITGNAVQRVYAVGEGEVDPVTLSQNTYIQTTVESYFGIENGESKAYALESDAKTTGTGDYSIACGYEEYASPAIGAEKFVYNECPYEEAVSKPETYGVADNSCCYERPYKIASYPVDGAGLPGQGEQVCPNTLLEFEFENEIDKKSIENNFVIAIGHEDPDYLCSEDGLDDVSDLINNTKIIAKANEAPGFFQKIWNFIKGFFVRIFAQNTFATTQDVDDVVVWCAGNVTATPEVVKVYDDDDKVIGSKVRLYLNTILPTDSFIALHLKGGNKGITDIRGVGIKNDPTEAFSMLEDSIVFYTGSKVCKIDSVEVDPDQYLFDTPNSSHEFDAITKTKTGQQITKISGQYNWVLTWQPQGHDIVDIPNVTSAPATFTVNNLEGSLLAVANVKITEDIDTEGGSDKNRIFTGTTYLEVNFCENPWPARQANNQWSEFKDGIYNFSFSYCADAGLSGTTVDDLPYLSEPISFISEGFGDGPIIKSCRVSNSSCDSNSDCVGDLYDIPGVGEINLPNNKGLCWKNSEVYLGDGEQYIQCEDNNDCLGSASAELVVYEKADISFGEIKEIIADSGYHYSIYNGPNEDGILLADVSNLEDPQMLANVSLKGAKTMELMGDNYMFVVSDVSNGQILNIFSQEGGGLVKIKSLDWLDGYLEDLIFFNDRLYIISDSGTDGNLSVYNLDNFENDIQDLNFSLGNALEYKINLAFEPRKIVLNQFGGIDYAVILSAKGDNTTSLQIFNVKDKIFETKVEVVGTPKSLDFIGDEIYFTVYESNNNGKLYRIRFGEEVQEILSFLSEPNLLKVDSDSIYISFGIDKFSIFDRVNLSQVLSYAAPSYVNTFDVAGNYAYIGSLDNGTYRILDISSAQDNLGLTCFKYFNNYKDLCVPINQGIIFSDAIKEDSLWSYVFFNDNKNDDIFGVQIFKNSPDPSEFAAKSISQWYAERFDNVSAMQPIQLAGYNGLTDGRSYYINALNETLSGDIYSNVYLFSVNKDAQQNTLQMFEKILNSIEFNTNITDHGRCMDIDANGNLDALATIATDCNTDFDCRDSVGNKLPGTNGTCSIAKTKMFRDLARLPKIAELQNKIIDPLEYPELKSGTYLPGYTVSRWPNSWSTFGTQDEINMWVGCNFDNEEIIDNNIDSYTCWNAVSSTYHCPVFSSVYEYEFVSSTGFYRLHGPLEYFDLDSPMVEYFIDEDYFTTDPWCEPGFLYSPFGEKCGDGIVNPGEQCDPPGKTKKSNLGYIVIQSGQCNYELVEKECGTDVDCPVSVFYLGDTQYNVPLALDEKVCQYDNYLLYGDVANGEPEIIQCSSLFDCENYLTNGPEDKELKTLSTNPEIFYINNDFFLDPDEIDNFSCSNIEDVHYFYGVSTIACEVAILESENEEECNQGYMAVASCNDSCNWEYGSCQEIYKCGNGIVEGSGATGEKCDDGALNGTYGHCADENSVDQNGVLIGACQGLHGQYCGNNEKDYVDNNGNGIYDAGEPYLEFCDLSELPNKQAFIFFHPGQGDILYKQGFLTVDCPVQWEDGYIYDDYLDLEDQIVLAPYLEKQEDSLFGKFASNNYFDKLFIASQQFARKILNVDVAMAISCEQNSDCEDGILCTRDICLTFNCVNTFWLDSVIEKNPQLSMCRNNSGHSCDPGLYISETYDSCVGCISNDNCNDDDFCTEDYCVDNECVYEDKPLCQVCDSDADCGDSLIGSDIYYSDLGGIGSCKKALCIASQCRWLDFTNEELQTNACEFGAVGCSVPDYCSNDDQADDSNKCTHDECNDCVIEHRPLVDDEWQSLEEDKEDCCFVDNIGDTNLNDTYCASGFCSKDSTNMCLEESIVLELFYDQLEEKVKNACTGYTGVCADKLDIVCNTDFDCQITPLVYDSPISVSQLKNIVSGTFNVNKPITDKGNCIPIFTAYNKQKEASCSWDCQSYGGYCGDGYMQSIEGEECDDGNDKNQDGCNNDCLKENMACLEAGPFFTTSSGYTYVYLNEGFSQSKLDQLEYQGHTVGLESPLIVECKEGSLATGKAICLAYGFACHSLEVYPAGGADSFVEFNFNSDLYTNSCGVDLNTILNEQPYRLVCEGIYEGSLPDQEKEKPDKYCGNGVADGTYCINEETGKEIKDCSSGKQFVEVCDMGDNNGIKCTPEYNKSCTYCSNDCEEVLTFDSEAYCGNGEIDFIDKDAGTHEACENVAGQIKSYNSVAGGSIVEVNMNCDNEGEYLCQNQCMDLVNNCITCGFVSEDDGGVSAKVKILNVLTGGDDTIDWPIGDLSYLNFIYSKDTQEYVDSKNKPISNQNNDNTQQFQDKINTDLACNAGGGNSGRGYSIQFDRHTIQASSHLDENKMFDFLVKNESEEVINEYAISPPVPDEDTFRVVVKWTDEDKDVEFSGAVFNEGFGLEGGDPIILYNTVSVEGNICSETNYESSCYDYNGVYVHQEGNLEKTYIQAITIDTTKRGISTFNYGFVVEQTNVPYSSNTDIKAIWPYNDSNLTVELYKYREGQDLLSIYKPYRVFEIKNSKKGTNQTSRFWHVFNLVYNEDEGGYEVVLVDDNENGVIKTIEEGVWEGIPDPIGGFGSLISEFDEVDASNFFYNGEAPTGFESGDIMVVEQVYDVGSNSPLIKPFIEKNSNNFINFVSCIDENSDIPVDIQQNIAYCYPLISDINKYWTVVLDIQDEDAGEYYWQDVKVLRLENNIKYRYITQYLEIGYDEFSSVYQGLGLRSLDLYLGLSDSDGGFILKDLNLDNNLDKIYDEVVEDVNDAQWYAFDIWKENNNLYIDIADEFLSSDVGIGEYYEYNN
ncbi:MAG: LamG-like jellyroll fold domain-containing protein [Candidatus Magasanikbacteria bacterium]